LWTFWGAPSNFRGERIIQDPGTFISLLFILTSSEHNRYISGKAMCKCLFLCKSIIIRWCRLWNLFGSTFEKRTFKIQKTGGK
jgi:hypothetical protein